MNEQKLLWEKYDGGNMPYTKYEVMIHVDHSFGSGISPLLSAVYCTPYLLP